MKPRPILDRLIEKLHVDERGCWIFTGAKTKAGYGSIRRGRYEENMALTHRVMWEQLVGVIPDDKVIDHLCRVRACCNPDHLELVSVKANNRRGAWPLRGHCKRGHEMTTANTYLLPSGYRQCKACKELARNTYRYKQASQLRRGK